VFQEKGGRHRRIWKQIGTIGGREIGFPGRSQTALYGQRAYERTIVSLNDDTRCVSRFGHGEK